VREFRDFSHPSCPTRFTFKIIQANVINGLKESELTISDLDEYKMFAERELIEQGAEFGDDYDLRTIHDMAAHEALRESPFGLSKGEMRFGIPANGMP
jgi:hypothetical protein